MPNVLFDHMKALLNLHMSFLFDLNKSVSNIISVPLQVDMT